MLLNLRDLGEIRTNEMGGIKTIVLMGIGHDLQETFIRGWQGAHQGLDWLIEGIGGLEIENCGFQSHGRGTPPARFDFPFSVFQFSIPGVQLRKVCATSKPTMYLRINELANG